MECCIVRCGTFLIFNRFGTRTASYIANKKRFISEFC